MALERSADGLFFKTPPYGFVQCERPDRLAVRLLDGRIYRDFLKIWPLLFCSMLTTIFACGDCSVK